MDIDDIYKCTIEAAQEAFDEPIKRQKRKDCDYRLKPILEKKEKSTGRKRPRTVQEDHQRTKEESEKHQT